MYTQKLIEHFRNPQNVGRIEDADGIGTIGDPCCGDFICIYIKVKNDLISEIKFEAYGCPAAIATTSILTELAEGKELKEVIEITEWDVVEAIGGLPDQKVHCSNLGTAALHHAIKSYTDRKKTGEIAKGNPGINVQSKE